MILNWLHKIAQRSGYLYPELGGGWNMINWATKEKELNIRRDELRQKAASRAESLGHELKPWSNINSSYCAKCARRVQLFSVNSNAAVVGSGGLEGGRIQGRAVYEPCSGDAITPYELPDEWGHTHGMQKW
ncbi:hypothetical protein LCGC14_1527630 [marine sediment metagenome]|uniref:Uncharacterized protein n=1 Tax=marine sediment metagenome TaxID=412755 RepID=A0A0F9IX70_9ZZZZ